MTTKLTKILLVIGIVLLIALGFMSYRNWLLKETIKSSDKENKELVIQVKELEDKNDSLFIQIDSLDKETIRIKADYEAKLKAKKKLVEKVKEIEIVNDTILIYEALNEVNDSIIRDLEGLVRIKDDIILNQKAVIQNDSIIKQSMSLAIAKKDEEIALYEKRIKKQQKQLIFWRTTTLVATGAVITLICI